MTRLMTFVLVSLLMAASLSACGRKGNPDFPPGASYPQQYPSPN